MGPVNYLNQRVEASVSKKLFDISEKKVRQINRKVSPIKDSMISEHLKKKNISIKAYLNLKNINKNQDLIIICLPTDYDEKTNKFNTAIIDNYLYQLTKNFSNILSNF